MRLLFLIFVIAWFHPSVYSAPFDVRIGRGLALRLHRRQVAYQGYPGYPEYTSTTSQQTFNQNVATQQTGVTSSQTLSSADLNGSPGATVASTPTTQTGQQQLATQTGARVVPVQNIYHTSYSSLSAAENSYPKNSSSAQDVTQSSGNSYKNSSAAPVATNSTLGNSYPVYYVSSYQEPTIQQPISQPTSNATTNPPSSSSTLITSSSARNKDNYPVYYVTSPNDESQQTPGISDNNSILDKSTKTVSPNNDTDSYPIYYVSSYNNATTQKTPAQNITAGSINGTDTSDSYPVYNVVSPETSKDGLREPSNSKVPDSPVTYEIINSTSTSKLNGNNSVPSSIPFNNTQSTASSSNYPSASTSAPASPPANSAYNYSSYPVAPAPYSTGSTSSPASAPSPATYQGYGTPSTSAYPAPAPAPYPAPSYYGYSANQPSASPSTVQSPAQPSNNSYASISQAPAPAPAPALAPAPAPAPALAPSSSSPSTIQTSALASTSSYISTNQSSALAPASAPAPPPVPAYRQTPVPALTPASAPAPASASSASSPQITGVSSSPPPLSSEAESSYSSAGDQTSSSVQVLNTPTSLSNLSSQETLNSEYENASYVIATPPEKETIMFLPSPSFPLSSQATKSASSKNAKSSSSKQMNQPSLLNATISKPPALANTTEITANPTSKPQVPPPAINNTNTQQTSNASQSVVPQNISFPAFRNMTDMSNTSFGEPSYSPLPAPTDGPIIEIPLSPEEQFHSPSVVKTKPPPSHLPTKPPPAAHSVLVTTKPPAAVGAHATAKHKANELGFGDKYLASQNKRARHRNVIFDGIAGDSQSFSNYQVFSQHDVFFPRNGRKRRNVPVT